MSYTNQSRLEKAISAAVVIQLTDDSGSGSIDSDNLNMAITTSDGEIDGYLQAHYSVPLVTTTGLVSAIADDLSIYYLYRRRRNSFLMPEDVVTNYDKRIKQLTMINEGKLDLGIEPVPASSSNVLAQSSGPDQVMTGGSSGSLKDF